MATSVLRVGRLTSLKCLQLERCGILGTPSFCTLVEEPMKPAKKSKSKVIEAPDGRASLLANKTVVGFPVKLFASGILQTQALSEIESLTYPVAVETLVDTVGPAVAEAKSAAVEEQVTTEESLERVASPVVNFIPPVATAEDPVTLSESVTVTTTTPVAEEANISFAQETATEAPTQVFETVASQESSATPIMDSAPAFEAEPVSLEVTTKESLEHVASPVVNSIPPVATAEDPVTLSDSVTVTTTTPVAEEANISFAQETATEAPTPVFETVASQESSATPIMDSAPVFEASPYAEPVSLEVTTKESLEHVASPVVNFIPPVATAEDPVTLSESVTVTTTTPVAEEANISFAQETATEAPTPVLETVASQESSATPIMDSAPVFEASPYAEPVSLEVTARKLVTFEITEAELSVTQKEIVFEAAIVSDISTHTDAAPVVGEVLHEGILAVASSTVDPVVTATASSEPVDVSSSSSSDSDSEDEKSDDEKSEVEINGQSKEADLTENKVKDHVSETGPVSVIPAEDLPEVTPLVTTEAGYRVVEAQAAPELTAVKETPTVVPETLPKPFLEVAGNHTLAGGSEELIEAVLKIATDPKELMAETAPGVEVTATEVIDAALHMVQAAAEDASESIPAEALGEFKSVAEAPTADPKELMAEAAPGVDVTTTESVTAAVHMVHAAVEDVSESIPAEALGEFKSVAEAPTADPKELMAEAAPGVDVTTTESVTAAVHMVHTTAEDASESIPAEALGESVAEAPAEVILDKAFPEAASEDIPAYPAAKTIPVEAADEVTAEAISENISESPPVESTEEQLDLAPVVGQAAGEELQTEAQAEPEPVEASEEAATTPPQAEPEPFDISTYKNYQHHSYNPYTFADLDLEMFKYRLPQPSSGRPSPRH